MLPPPCLIVESVFWELYEMTVFLRLFPTKSSVFLSSDHNILSQNEAGFSRWWWARYKLVFQCLNLNKGFFLGVQECSPICWNVQLIVPFLNSAPAVCISFWNSPEVVNDNRSSCLFIYFTRTYFPTQNGSQAMFLPFLNEGSTHTDVHYRFFFDIPFHKYDGQ